MFIFFDFIYIKSFLLSFLEAIGLNDLMEQFCLGKIAILASLGIFFQLFHL
jgi:hypothetical protein